MRSQPSFLRGTYPPMQNKFNRSLCSAAIPFNSMTDSIRSHHKPLKICMLAYSFYETDARIKQYATALVERGDSVDVIALRRPGQPARSVLNGVNVFRIQTSWCSPQSCPNFWERQWCLTSMTFCRSSTPASFT